MPWITCTFVITCCLAGARVRHQLLGSRLFAEMAEVAERGTSCGASEKDADAERASSAPSRAASLTGTKRTAPIVLVDAHHDKRPRSTFSPIRGEKPALALSSAAHDPPPAATNEFTDFSIAGYRAELPASGGTLVIKQILPPSPKHAGHFNQGARDAWLPAVASASVAPRSGTHTWIFEPDEANASTFMAGVCAADVDARLGEDLFSGESAVCWWARDRGYAYGSLASIDGEAENQFARRFDAAAGDALRLVLDTAAGTLECFIGDATSWTKCASRFVGLEGVSLRAYVSIGRGGDRVRIR